MARRGDDARRMAVAAGWQRSWTMVVAKSAKGSRRENCER